MNRNTNAHFSELPNIEISRSKFDRSFSHKLSGNVGDLIPIFWDEILPGDTVSMDTSKVIRFQTLLTPFMDQIYCDIYYMFVPYRLLWDHWVNFMGENTASAWIPQTEYTVPQLKVFPSGFVTAGGDISNNEVGTILDYLGYPVASGGDTGTDGVDINALPFRAYAKICDDWFRDENLVDPLNRYTGDATQYAVHASTLNYVNDVPLGYKPYKVAKFADYFTSALPAPQKGDPVSISFSNSSRIPVYPGENNIYGSSIPVVTNPMVFLGSSTTDGSYFYMKASNSNIYRSSSSSSFDSAFSAGLNDNDRMSPLNLWADLGQSAALFNVNDLRMAFQLQKLLERDARGGTRYIEVIKSHFNVDSPDQRLQRSEYLGGNRFAVTVNQVANTAQSQQDFLGDLGAFSITADTHSDFTKSFTEHGILMGLMCLRYDHTYSQGLDRAFQRKSRFDFYWPVFANIGEQPINKSEIFLYTHAGVNPGDDDVTNLAQTFGYQEAWADYRYKPNKVSGELRPYVANGLYSWTLADNYASAPSLSAGWIQEDLVNVDRVLAVTSQAAHQFWADFYFDFKHTRPMPVYSIPGLIDHN